MAMEPSDGARVRTLSKSDFKLARTCGVKLYFRENGYPDNRDTNPYLALLAEGGYMVEALAKAKYPDAIQLEYGRDHRAAAARTLELLQCENVTICEATLLVGRRMARADIIEKRGNSVRLIEVKAKSFDGDEHRKQVAAGAPGALRGARPPYAIASSWADKLEDVTFQYILLEQLLPGAAITPYLAIVDKSIHTSVDNAPRFFELVKIDGDLHSARYTGGRDDLAQLNFVTELDVSAEVAMLRGDVEAAATLFESRLDAPLDVHLSDVERGSKCAKCEFRSDVIGVLNGFRECWGAHADASPHVLDLFRVGEARAPDGAPIVDWMLKKRRALLTDVPTAGLVRRDGTRGPNATRQVRQIEHTQSRTMYVGPSLRDRIAELSVPLHCIDFETSRLAVPYHAGMRPYGLVAFQWSSHEIEAFAQKPKHIEWLNNTHIWPNQLFAESLRAAIGDEGPVLTWSHYEGAVLKEIVRDLSTFGRDASELSAWMEDVVDRRIVDLHKWAKEDYYHPGMQGRTSIKFVLDAIWQSDDNMRRQFEEWTGMQADPERDPYASLPPVKIAGVLQDVHEGTGAMRAYQEMMYGAQFNDPEVREGWARLLRQYCALDTLSMVLILEHWRRIAGA